MKVSGEIKFSVYRLWHIFTVLFLLYYYLKEVEVTDLNQFRADREEPVVFLVSHAQVKRTEIYVASDEESYRRTNYPTIHERVDLQREWAHEQLKDARMASQREAVKRLADKKLQEARDEATKRKKEEKRKKQILKGIKPKEDDAVPDEEVKKGDEDDDDANDENSVAVLEEALQEAEAEMGEEQEEEPMSSSAAAKKRREDKKKFLDDLTDIKERKILASRDTKAFHREHSRSEAYRKAFWFSLGWRGVMRVKQAGVTTKDMTVVLPWLLVMIHEGHRFLIVHSRVTAPYVDRTQGPDFQPGRPVRTGHHSHSQRHARCAESLSDSFRVYENTCERQVMLFRNCHRNLFFKFFIVPSNDADIGRYFKKIVNFIKRAENCKGRVREYKII